MPQPPRYWFRFVDDTFVIQQQSNKQLFLDHVNNIDPAIRFTVEGNQENRSIPFLDTLVKPEADNSLSITLYHKPTHTDQYLQLDSHHNLSARYSVKGTLTHMVKTVCTGPELFQRQINHLREALVKFKYPRWAINKVQSKYINSNHEDNSNTNSSQEGSPAQGTHSPSGNTEGRPPQGKTQHWTHSHPIYTRTREELSEDLREIWYPHTLQGEYDLKTTVG